MNLLFVFSFLNFYYLTIADNFRLKIHQAERPNDEDSSFEFATTAIVDSRTAHVPAKGCRSEKVETLKN